MRIGHLTSVASLAVLTATTAYAADFQPIDVKTTERHGRTIRIETYALPEIVIETDAFTIARRRALAIRLAASDAPVIDAAVTCRLDIMGKAILSDGCEQQGVAGAAERIATLLAFAPRAAIRRTIAPSVSFEKSLAIDRLAAFRIRLDSMPAMPVPSPVGPIVERAEIVSTAEIGAAFNYPEGALRADARGRLSALCRVEQDQSIYCEQESFSPSDNARYFRGAAEELGFALTAPKLLRDGTSSAGAQFHMAISFAIPND